MNPRERCFFKVCYELTSNRRMGIWQVMDIFEGVIPRKQMVYYLTKWVRLGFYEYGVCIDSGWFIPRNIPARYFKGG